MKGIYSIVSFKVLVLKENHLKELLLQRMMKMMMLKMKVKLA